MHSVGTDAAWIRRPKIRKCLLPRRKRSRARGTKTLPSPSKEFKTSSAKKSANSRYVLRKLKSDNVGYSI